jgi:hypothetical protein
MNVDMPIVPIVPKQHGKHCESESMEGSNLRLSRQSVGEKARSEKRRCIQVPSTQR